MVAGWCRVALQVTTRGARSARKWSDPASGPGRRTRSAMPDGTRPTASASGTERCAGTRGAAGCRRPGGSRRSPRSWPWQSDGEGERGASLRDELQEREGPPQRVARASRARWRRLNPGSVRKVSTPRPPSRMPAAGVSGCVPVTGVLLSAPARGIARVSPEALQRTLERGPGAVAKRAVAEKPRRAPRIFAESAGSGVISRSGPENVV